MTVAVGTGATDATATRHRIEVLDVLRGVAILGTLGTNVWLFTDPWGPAAALLPPVAPAGVGETVLRTLSNGKFLALLSVLFGAGLELQYRSARRRGGRWPGWCLWRAALLLVEGVLHYVFVFEWDILMTYALVSMAVAGIVGRSDRTVWTWLVTAGALHCAAIGALSLGGSGVGPVVPPGGPDLYRAGSYAEQVAARVEGVGLYRSEAIIIIPLTIALFLLGSRLMRAGAFARGPRGAWIRTRLAIVGLGVGLPLNLATSFAGPQWLFVDRYLCAPVVACGLLAAVTGLVHRMSPVAGVARRGLTAIGRTALSCYVLQNIVCAVLGYGWGFGLASRLAGFRPWWVPVAWASVSLILAAAATGWLRRFDRGPLELAWHWAWQRPQR